MRPVNFSAIALAAMIIACATLFPSRAEAKGTTIVRMNSNVEVADYQTVDDVIVIGGNVAVAGRVENNVIVVHGSVALAEKAHIGGEVVVIGGEVVRAPGATIDGKVTQVYLPRFIPSAATFLRDKWFALWATISMLVLLGFLGLAILLVALIPDNMGRIVCVLEASFASSLVWGIVWIVLIVPVAILLAISIVGIVLIPLEILLVALAMIIGYIGAAVFIGKNILISLRKFTIPFVDAIIGIVALFLIGFVPIVGPFVKAAFLAAGFGAVVTTRFGTAK